MTIDEILSKAHNITIKMLEQKYDGMTNGEVIESLFPNVGANFSNVLDLNLWWNTKYKPKNEIHCNCTDEEIAKSFIEDVKVVEDLLPPAESEDKMGRLIDVDEVKKRYPIMRNDFGMVINESLHKELDKIPTVEAISKADMMTTLDKIKAEIKEYKSRQLTMGIGIEDLEKGKQIALEYVLAILDKYKVKGDKE